MKYCIAALLFLNSLAVGQESPALSLKTRIALPNVDGRMDHFAVDVKGLRLFVSALGNHTVEVLDLQAGRRVRTLSDLAAAQGQFYDATTGFLDSNGKQAGEIVVDAHPESFQLEKNGTRVFVNLPDKKEVQVADVVKGTILSRWPTTAATTCFPMALDEAHHRLFAGCRMPARLLVFDTESGKTVASPEIVGDTDDLFYDASRSRVYIIGGQGFIDVFR